MHAKNLLRYYDYDARKLSEGHHPQGQVIFKQLEIPPLLYHNIVHNFGWQLQNNTLPPSIPIKAKKKKKKAAEVLLDGGKMLHPCFFQWHLGRCHIIHKQRKMRICINLQLDYNALLVRCLKRKLLGQFAGLTSLP